MGKNQSHILRQVPRITSAACAFAPARWHGPTGRESALSRNAAASSAASASASAMGTPSRNGRAAAGVVRTVAAGQPT